MVEFGGSFGRYGQGSYIRALPQRAVLHFQNFSGGYFSAINRKEVPENTSPFAIDVEVTKANRLRRSPGTTLVELFPSNEPIKMVVHGSLDFTSELVLFDPPYLGVKRFGDTLWENKGLVLNNGGWFAWVNFGGTLIFSDGTEVYARQVNDGTNLTVVSEAPVAVTYESWAGRVWAGGAIIDENFEQLGLVWSAANSNYTDWTGVGSGFELLLDAISAGDRIIRLKSMGLDFMAVLLRRSIWVVRRTGQADRPGDPQPRVAGKGAVNHDVIQSTVKGIIYLSDDGVELFDGNQSEKISLPIDAELLPLDYGAILEYSSGYDSVRNRYYLHTPTGTTWVYEINFNRWFRRSLSAYASVEWPLQAEGAIVEGAPRVVFLGDQVDESAAPRAIAEEDQDSGENFGAPLTPIWEARPVAGQKINELLSTKLFNIEYVGAADIEIWAPDNHGNYDLIVQETLIPQSNLEALDVYAIKTGRLSSLMLRIPEGDIEVSDLQAIFQTRGPRVAIGEGGVVGNFPDRTTLLDFPVGQAWYDQSGPGGPEAPDWVIQIIYLGSFTYRLTLGGEDEPAFEVDEYVWDFGDGTTAITSVPEVEHTYAVGVYEPSVAIKHRGWIWAYYRYGLFEVEAPPEPQEFSADLDSGNLYSIGFPDPVIAFSSARAGSGFIFTETEADLQVDVSNGSAPPNPEEWQLARLFLCFDLVILSGVPISGRITLQGYGATDDFGETSIGLFIFEKGTPTNPLQTGDWAPSNASTVRASDDDYLMSEIGAAGPLVFELNEAGLAALETGRVWFVIRTNNDRLNTEPVGDGPASSNASFKGLDQPGEEPTLTVEY